MYILKNKITIGDKKIGWTIIQYLLKNGCLMHVDPKLYTKCLSPG